MGFFKSLVKEHGKTFFEPIGKTLAAAGIKKPNPFNPAHAWALKGVAWPYAKWMIARRLSSGAAPATADDAAGVAEARRVRLREPPRDGAGDLAAR